TARSSSTDEVRTPVTLRILPSADFATAWAAPTIARQFVTNFPSSATKKPVFVVSSFPGSSKTETRITAGPTRSATLRKSGAGLWAVGATVTWVAGETGLVVAPGAWSGGCGES